MIPYLDSIDLVLVMTVEPGFGGQKFMSDMMPKVSYIRKINPDILIEVDGGIGLDNAELVSSAGANLLVAGSSVFKSESVSAAISDLRNLSAKGMQGLRI